MLHFTCVGFSQLRLLLQFWVHGSDSNTQQQQEAVLALLYIASACVKSKRKESSLISLYLDMFTSHYFRSASDWLGAMTLFLKYPSLQLVAVDDVLNGDQQNIKHNISIRGRKMS